jgi:hypothetical protein
MPTVPAPNRLAALQRHILIAVTAFVVHGAGVGVDDGCVLRAGGLGRVVLLGGLGWVGCGGGGGGGGGER